MKRIFDFVFSFFGILLLFPLLLLISLLIWLVESESIYFRQVRIGQYGNPFTLIKFRTMERLSTTNKEFDVGDNSRVTQIGKILRKTKLDELPQLVNILRGEMSFVGPRPEVEEWTMIYTDKWKIIHKVKPGITDYASIKFRNEEELLNESDNPLKTYRDEILPQKLKLNIDYIENSNLFSDIKIIFLTIYTVIFK